MRSGTVVRLVRVLGGWLVSSLLLAQAASTAAGIPELIRAASAYESGRSLQPLRQIEDLARQAARDPALRKELEAGLVTLLTAESTLEAKQFAAQQLSTIGTEESLPALAQLLKAENTVSFGCQALSMHPSPKANQVLREGLQTAPGAARVPVIHTLASRQDAGAVDALTTLIQDPDPAVAEAAILALGKIANDPARAAIAALRKQTPPAFARAVAEASMNAAEKLTLAGETSPASAIYEDLLHTTQPAHVRRGAFEALLQLDADGGERRILEMLRGQDDLLKPVAIAGVRRLRSPEASATFASALPGLPPQEQVWLIDILANRRDAAARSAIQSSLSSPDASVRLAAIEATGKFGNVSSVPLLTKALANVAASRERMALERALLLLRGEEVDRAIIQELEGGAPRLKSMLIPILAKRESRAAVPAILASTGDPEIAEVAFRALGSLAQAEDAPVLLSKLLLLPVPAARSDSEFAAAQALFKMDDSSRRAELVLHELSRTTDPETRQSLLRLLPACPDDKALAALTQAKSDPHPQVRDTAIRALADWPDARAWEPLAEVYRQAESPPYRVLSLNALVRLAEEENARPDSRLIGRYRELLARARTDQDRKRILGALAGAAHPGALDLARTLLDTPGIRAEAELAVRQITEAIQKK